MEHRSYYFWKWADNDLPGRPSEVHAEMLAGRLPAALQAFDPTRLLKKLHVAAAEGRLRGEEWDWSVGSEKSSDRARFVFVCCPRIDSSEASVRRFAKRFGWLGLSGIDEATGQVIPCLKPKRNCFHSGQQPAERYYDIDAKDLPHLVRGIDPHGGDPFGIIEDSRGYFVQCFAEGRRFYVEWAQNRYFARKETQWDQWRAQDASRLAACGKTYNGEELPTHSDPDLMRYSDTLRIFEAFLRRECRPAQYAWRNINSLLE
jgi:hypothetical protein